MPKRLKNSKLKILENALPVLLFVILITLVILFINFQKSPKSANPGIQNTPEEIPLLEATMTVDDTTVKRESEECTLTSTTDLPTSWPSDVPLLINLISIESECYPNEYDSYIVNINYKEALSYLIFALEQDLKINGWTDINISDLSNEQVQYSKVSAKKDNRELLVELRESIDEEQQRFTLVTYRERL